MIYNTEYWINKLNLVEHPEGGYYNEVYRSTEEISPSALPARYTGNRPFSTAIYFLLPGNSFSALHRIRSDEVWHYYYGSPLSIHEIDSEGMYRVRQLGINADTGQRPQLQIPAGNWFGALVDNPESYTLVGCTVAPGFDFSDFELADRDDLLRKYPEHEKIINSLCR